MEASSVRFLSRSKKTSDLFELQEMLFDPGLEISQLVGGDGIFFAHFVS
jgi:hypothetical protein